MTDKKETVDESNRRQSDYYWWWDAKDGRKAGVSFAEWRKLKDRDK